MLRFFENQFDCYCFLNNNEYANADFEFMMAAGIADCIQPYEQSFEALKEFHDEDKDWLFGHFSYDLKNEIENLDSENIDGIEFPEMFFFRPQLLLKFKKDVLTAEFIYENEEDVKNAIEQLLQTSADLNSNDTKSHITPESNNIQARISKTNYIDAVKKLKEHIQKGDIYEINYCQEFYAEKCIINPVDVYLELNKLNPSPFSALYKIEDKYLICASPERFLQKNGNKLMSQPIKGTRPRGKDDVEDQKLKDALKNSEKDRRENVMIVDLVRNDLSRTAAKGTVNVDELYGIYSFPQVHQMISTISSELKEGIHFTEAIKYAFPMGSMTGAPKIRAMELAEKFEKTKRGLFSGAVGYISPDGDFDFNVVIRSILYNASDKYLSFQVGSAITSLSDPEEEYEECLLKANAMRKVLS